jgi:hypothetical protein
VGRAARDVDDEPDAARVVFERRVIESDALRRFSVSYRHAAVIADADQSAK